MSVAEVNDETGPVAMFLACRRKRWGGAYRYRYVVLDLDAARGGGAAVQEQAAALVELLKAHGIASVRVASGPSGGVHLWTACPAGLAPTVVRRIAEAAAALFPCVDPAPLLNAVSGAVRPPGAVHRAGGRAYLTDRTAGEAVATLRAGAPPATFYALATTLEAMAAAPALQGERRARVAAPRACSGGVHVPPSVTRLGPVVRAVGTCVQGRPRLAVPVRPLGKRAQAAARRRPNSDPGAHQGAVHATARACALAGWTWAQFADFAADAERSPALEWLRTAGTGTGARTALDDGEIARRVDRVWWLAVQAAARLPRRPSEPEDGSLSHAAALVADLLARIESAGTAPWRRPSGPADRAVLRAVAWLMLTAGVTEVSADVRRVGVLAGYSKTTAAAAIGRLTLDGWLEVTQDHDMDAGTARRVTLATAHQCPDDPHHMCATHTTSDQEQYGSDRRRNAAAPGGVGGDLLSRLGAAVAHQQAGVWHKLGHHAARTLEAVQSRPGADLTTLQQLTGYTALTVLRHVTAFATLHLVELQEIERGEVRVTRTARTLYEAGTDTRTASRPAELASVAVVEVSVARWWRREVAWCRLNKAEKRKRGRRAHARQAVIPGADPYDRAFPRRPGEGGDDLGEADHDTAFAIEAARIGAARLASEAMELARRGEVVDPAHLPSWKAAAAPTTMTLAA
ncbi:hypothetical protein ACFY0R_37880 [Streptomyces sp. NPDC001633]|uniref:hypothetical protein n=1 Tax=Streptomyces sp. NPDC001633 TaxID=3364595 RepID=UPI00369BDCF5